MSKRLTQEVEEIVSELCPQQGAIGMVTAEDVQRLVSVAANRGALAGWVMGMQSATNALKKEHQVMVDQLKELEKELAYMEKIK